LQVLFVFLAFYLISILYFISALFQLLILLTTTAFQGIDKITLGQVLC